MSNKKESLFYYFKKIIKFIPKSKAKVFIFLYIGMLILALIETVSLGIIAIFATAITNPEGLKTSQYINYILKYLNYDILQNIEFKYLLIFLSLIVLLVIIIKNLSESLFIYIKLKYSNWVSGYYGEKLVNNLLNTIYEFHLSKNSADLIIHFSYRKHIAKFLIAILQALNDILMVFVMFIAILIVNPLITLLVITFNGTAAYLIFVRVRKLLYKNAKEIRNNGEEINKHITQSIHGIKDVKIFNKEDEYILDNNLLIYKNVRLSALQQIYLKLPNWLMEIIAFSIISFSIFLLYEIIKSDSLTVAGILTLLAITAWKVLPALNRILNSITITKTEIPFIEKLFDLFDEIEKNKLKTKNLFEKESIVNFKKSIKFKNINFKYSSASKEIFKNLTFDISYGKVVGIIGTSGAGKSTLVDILIGLLKPSSGKILIDDIELTNDNVNQWIKKIGYVPQSPYLYDGTLAENIAFGYKNKNIDRDLVMKCCKMASLDNFIKNLPDGIDVKIGERGVRISGGQRQRIAIARALYKKPEIMIFDEATSSLDTKSEKLVQNTIYSLRDNITMLIIAHRLTTVKECDFILWLENGKIRMIDKSSKVLSAYKKIKH